MACFNCEPLFKLPTSSDNLPRRSLWDFFQKKLLLGEKSKISPLLPQATGPCLWGSGCPGRAIATTSPTALGTARETGGREALQHSKARRVRRPPVMVTHTTLLSFTFQIKCFVRSIQWFLSQKERRKITSILSRLSVEHARLLAHPPERRWLLNKANQCCGRFTHLHTLAQTCTHTHTHSTPGWNWQAH